MSDEILDSVLSEETLSMLDKHGATIDKVDGVLSKLDSILSKPLIKDVFDLLKDKAVGNVEAAVDPWGMTIGEMQGAQQIAPQVQAPQRTITTPLEGTVSPEPVVHSIPKSEIHQAMHDSIDQMSEEQIMEMIENESKSQSSNHQDTECDPEDDSDIGPERSGEEHPSGIDGETSKD